MVKPRSCESLVRWADYCPGPSPCVDEEHNTMVGNEGMAGILEYGLEFFRNSLRVLSLGSMTCYTTPMLLNEAAELPCTEISDVRADHQFIVAGNLFSFTPWHAPGS